MHIDNVLEALTAWAPAHAALFSRARVPLALLLDRDDRAEALTPAGWVYDGAAGPDVVHRWHTEDEQGRVYVVARGGAYDVEVGTAGERTIAAGRSIASALQHAGDYMVAHALTDAPGAPAPSALPPLRARAPAEEPRWYMTPTHYILADDATSADVDALVLAIIRDGKAHKDKYDAVKTRTTLPLADAFLRSKLLSLSREQLRRLREAFTRIPEDQIRLAQGWSALGSAVRDVLDAMIRGK